MSKQISRKLEDSKEERVDQMSPTIRAIEKEKILYVNGMKKYLENLKTLSNSEIKEHSNKVLTESKIIDKKGNLINYHDKVNVKKSD